MVVDMEWQDIKNRWLNGTLLEGYYTFDQLNDSSIDFGNKIVPNNEDWMNLFKVTTYTFDEVNKEGVFTFQDGTEFRLPAAGYRITITGDSDGSGIYGSYWLSSVPSGSVDASRVYFNSIGKLIVSTNGRADGFSVYCIPKIVKKPFTIYEAFFGNYIGKRICVFEKSSYYCGEYINGRSYSGKLERVDCNGKLTLIIDGESIVVNGSEEISIME